MSKKRPNYAGHVVHVMNRGVDRKTLFHTPEEYEEFRSLLGVALRKHRMRILEWTIMPNHWHLLLWPEDPEQLPKFMRWLTSMHARIVRKRTDTIRMGALYQSRYRSVFVKPGIHLDKLRNYLAMNPVKASLVENASDWIWGSAKRIKDNKPSLIIPLSMGPKPHPINLEQILTDPNFLDRSEQKLVSHSLHNDLPFGDLDWVNRISTEHGLQLKTDQLVPFL